ncbi:hypothetical protein AL532_08545 [Pseudomonas monteilii]|uniref:Uncharacterized protein n=1 Tax=Pseudomonas monteilii TaxID=76759 RepID=A0A6G6V5Y4_9PSED|nr:hypothetical protein AL532_08545 [Pseudomonas monteilii]MVF48389.1 hypothetical protein [Pseudomonas monteilii]QIG21170.1 hypothetical protein FY041_27035 [Pseudomonas monteilii]QIG26420.1 hypothetical protein FY043_27030 [Pseudomonas monteilii]
MSNLYRPLRAQARSHRYCTFLKVGAIPVRAGLPAKGPELSYLANTTNLPTACRCPNFSMAAPASASG